MSFLRRCFAAATCAAVAAVAALSLPVKAQDYPSRPVRLVLGYAPGGTTDTLARLLAKKLSEAWKQSVVVENRAGGGGTIGADAVAKAPADGYTILIGTPAQITVNQHLMDSIPYDPARDFAAVTQIATSPSVLILTRTDGVASYADFVRWSKTMQRGLNYATTGIGSPGHLMGAVFAKETAIPMEFVHYKGTGPSVADLIAGHVQLMFNTVQVALPLVKAGQVIPLAVSGDTRFAGLPQVPTLREVGVNTVESGVWYGVFVPSGTPARVIDTIHSATTAALRSPDIQEVLQREGARIVANTPAEFSRFIAQDSARWQRVIREAGIKP
ncbi:MAG: Bug family tripartite tricarboxylate transporter substrate binding protein [Burkholderiaceae bacterium]